MILHILITFLKDLSSNYLLLILTLHQEFTFLKLRYCETPDIEQSTLYRVSVEREREGETEQKREGGRRTGRLIFKKLDFRIPGFQSRPFHSVAM